MEVRVKGNGSCEGCCGRNFGMKPTTGIRNISPTAVKGQTREPQRSGQQSSRFTVTLIHI
ncbi:hypothetical protein WN51_10042 [Melipona quadrifasciata]|uniref:Uncharacterized protein n=1 Tax=Melipona quadrifasciata TaxID=166423 RepID=A0A0M9ABG0_9HYME|nr:hypothetical protein WN51_10042 [Melipona quadrifasciata]